MTWAFNQKRKEMQRRSPASELSGLEGGAIRPRSPRATATGKGPCHCALARQRDGLCAPLVFHSAGSV